MYAVATGHKDFLLILEDASASEDAPLSSFVLQCSEVLISVTQHYNLRGGLCCLAVLVRQDPLS